jgi:hypothetical protein
VLGDVATGYQIQNSFNRVHEHLQSGAKPSVASSFAAQISTTPSGNPAWLRVGGVDGVILANVGEFSARALKSLNFSLVNDPSDRSEQVDASSEVPFTTPVIATRLSFDNGRTWQPVTFTQSTSNSSRNSRLELIVGSAYSPEGGEAGGVVMALGWEIPFHLNQETPPISITSHTSQPSTPDGEAAEIHIQATRASAYGSEKSTDTEPDVFFTNDAGRSWQRVAQGPHVFAAGDGGDLLLLARVDGQPTASVLVSLDRGASWQARALPFPMVVRHVLRAGNIISVISFSFHFIFISSYF